MKTAFAVAALVGYAAAECPNACSGHGTCGAKDACSCYQNYQGNDCSERTCYFGLAHVDSPKGDLNADGLVSGPLTTVITGSEVYPWGTTEQFPNANSNEGHFYMECSNKGICDRKSGTCDCFDGYTGTACARASCPNDCSGHGTCESIKEFAEMRSFDTNAHHTPSTRVAGSTNQHDFSSAVEESYSYDLWDADKTMGCKCDPVYYGADCSLKKCKYGVDPLFYDNTDGTIHQTTIVHLGSVGGCSADTCAAPTVESPATLTGSFKMIFYDVFGEKYVTKELATNTQHAATQTLVCTGTAGSFTLTLDGVTSGAIQFGDTKATAEGVLRLMSNVPSTATMTYSTGTAACDAGGTNTITIDFVEPGARSTFTNTPTGGPSVVHAVTAYGGDLTPLSVQRALEALPNGVISEENTDVTGTPPAAVTVAMATKAGTIATAGGFGGGAVNAAGTPAGAGFGTTSGFAAASGSGTGTEFTVTFKTNPGILKSVELDTSNIGNKGVADYWVANARQGEFSSRYTTNLGRINSLAYGSKKVFTNTDLSGSVVGTADTGASLVKVGGQEFRVDAENSAFLTLSEAYLGASITATLTDTGAYLGYGVTYADTTDTGVAQATNFVATTGVFTFASDLSVSAKAVSVQAGSWIQISHASDVVNTDGSSTSCHCRVTDASTGTAPVCDLSTNNCISFGTPAVTYDVKVGSHYAAETRTAVNTACTANTCVTAATTAADGSFELSTATYNTLVNAPAANDPSVGVFIEVIPTGGGTSPRGMRTCTGQIGAHVNGKITLAAGSHDCHTVSGSVTTADISKVITTHAKISLAGVDSAIKANSLAQGAKLSVGGCAFEAVKSANKLASQTDIGFVAGGNILHAHHFDCIPDANFDAFDSTSGNKVYRRSDNPNNQNIYKAPVDTGDMIVSNLMLTRGSADAYLVADTGKVVKTYATTVAQPVFTVDAAHSVAANEVFFVNGLGPMVEATGAGTSLSPKTTTTATFKAGQLRKFFNHAIADNAAMKMPVFAAITADADRTAVAANSVLLLDGRRYRVKSRGATGDAGAAGKAYVQLSENYAGGRVEQLCTNCVAATTGATGKITSFNAGAGTAETGGRPMPSVTANDQLAINGYLHQDFLTTVVSTTATEITGSVLGLVGTAAKAPAAADVSLVGGQWRTTSAERTVTGIALYKVGYGAGGAVAATSISEVATGSNTYQYVAQCSNRGTCDASTGICKCFKGYANDNCDKQNMLAM